MNKLTASVLIVIAIGLYYTFTSPQYDKAKVLSLEAEEYKNVLENISRIIDSRNELLALYEDIPEQELEKLARILPEEVDTVRLALDLDRLSSQAGIALQEIGIEDASRNASLIVLPEYGLPYKNSSVVFSFVSNYKNFRTFLSSIERSLRILDVRSLTFRVSDTGVYEHKITVDTYSLSDREPTKQAGVGADLIDLSERLSSVTLDQKLFNTPGYLSLQDASTTIPVEPVGRPNPFSIIGRD